MLQQRKEILIEKRRRRAEREAVEGGLNPVEAAPAETTGALAAAG